MEFFNKKEEVIHIELTQFGRFLLSKGKFKPAFYSFFDDNVLYNSENANFSEEQNESETRIRDTPTVKPQISFSSLEKTFANNYNLIISGELSPVSQDLQRTADKHYSLAMPIGTSNINSEYAPSWTVQFLNGDITSSAEYVDLTDKSGGHNVQKIPQLNTEMKIDVLDYSNLQEDEIALLDESEEGMLDSNIVITSDEEEMFILIKLNENNGFFQKKNFDIEMFEVVEDTDNGTTLETLRPLNFQKPLDITNEVDFLDETSMAPDQTEVAYYFDVLIDDEINDETLCDLDPAPEKKGVFSDKRTKTCQDIINQQKKKVFDIYEEGSDTPGEVC